MTVGSSGWSYTATAVERHIPKIYIYVCPYAGGLHCLSVQCRVIFCRMTTKSSIMIPWSSINKPRSHAAKKKVAHRSSTVSEIYWSAAQMTFPSMKQRRLWQITRTFLHRNMPECVKLSLRLSVHSAGLHHSTESEYSLCRRTDPEIHNAFSPRVIH